MNSLIITQKTSETERYVPNEVITTLYNIGKDDDEHQSLTSGVDTTDVNRPVTSVDGSIAVRVTYDDYIRYLAVKFPNLNISADSTYIHFKDPEVERVLLAKGLGDGTGITPQDAAAATSLNGAFKNNSVVTKFNELKYFTFVNQNGSNEMFRNAQNLEKVDFSNTVTVGSYQYAGSGLKEVNIPNLVNFTGTDQFVFCSGLLTIKNLGSVSSIPARAFRGCSNLTSVILPDSCRTIQSSAFKDCNILSSIENINKVTSFGESCFEGCSSLTLTASDIQQANNIGSSAFRSSKLSDDIVLNNVTTFGTNVFTNCSNITSIDLTNVPVTSIATNEYNGCTALQKIKYGSGVTNLKSNWKNGLGSQLFIKGVFDNISSADMYNVQLQNITIINPIKTSKFFAEQKGNPNTCYNHNNCYSHSIFIPKATTLTPTGGSFYGVPEWSFFQQRSQKFGIASVGLLYFKDISSFKVGNFYCSNITNLVINNTTPPTLDNSDTSLSSLTGWWDVWGNSIFGDCNIGTLWVPNSAVSTYQADPQYSNLTIKGIDEKDANDNYLLPRFATFADWEAAYEYAVANNNPVPIGLIEEYMD